MIAMMRFVIFVGALSALGLVACGTLGTSGVVAGQTPAQQAQGLINEGNATLSAVANVIAQNVVDGTMTAPEAQSALDHVRELSRQIDSAQSLLNSGAALDAKAKADIAHRLVLALHKQVAAKARKPI
jgi:hypothetical protein